MYTYVCLIDVTPPHVGLQLTHESLLAAFRYTGVSTGRAGINPPFNLHNFLNVCLHKNTIQALLLYSLNPKFRTGKR